MKKIQTLALTTIITSILFCNPTFATANMSVSEPDIKSGDDFTVSLSIDTVAAWNIHISSTGPVSGCTLADADTTPDALDAPKTFTSECKATGSGEINIRLTGDYTTADGTTTDLSDSITVMANETPEESAEGTGTGDIKVRLTKSEAPVDPPSDGDEPGGEPEDEPEITVPGTGLFSMQNPKNPESNSNLIGIAIGIILLCVTLAISITAILKNRNHKVFYRTNSHFAIHALSAKTVLVSSLTVLSLIAMIIPLATNHINNDHATMATSGDTLTIDIGTVLLDAELQEKDAVTVASSTVKIGSSTTNGYNLSVYADSEDLMSNDMGVTTKISGLSSDNNSPVALSTNTWGIAIAVPTSKDSEVWYKVPASATTALAVKNVTTSTSIDDSTTIYYGINVNDKLDAGEYTGKLNYIVVANPAPDPTPEPNGCNPAGTSISEVACMQDLTDTNRASIIESMVSGEQYQLKDSRDDRTYSVAKLADGNLWMTRNLDLPGGTTITNIDSNLNTKDSYTLPESSTSGFDSHDGTASYVYNVPFENNDRTTCGSNHPCYSYYSWNTTIAGDNLTSDDVSNDICPHGWRLPIEAEYDALIESYVTGSDLTASPFFGTYAGSYYSSSLSSGGSHGFYWSSTVDDGDNAYFLTFYGSGAYIDYSDKHFGSGYAVRCIARS